MSGYSWPEFHGAVTHFPIAFLIAVFLFDAGAVSFKKPEWRVVSFWLLVVAVCMSAPALLSGWQTGKTLYGAAPTPPAIFMTHRLFAFVTSAIALLLLAWRIVSKDQLSGAARAVSVVLALVVMAAVSYTGYLGGKMVFAGSDTQSAEGARSTSLAVHSSKAQIFDPALIISGKNLYAGNGCSGCHQLNGQGGKTGPDLSHESSRHNTIAWQVAHLENPSKVHPGSVMPAYGSLPPNDLKALAAYMASRQ